MPALNDAKNSNAANIAGDSSGKSPEAAGAIGRYGSPYRLLIIMAVSIFITEMSIMAFLRHVWTPGGHAEHILDSTFLVIMVFPILYFFFLRPLTLQIYERALVEKALRFERNKLFNIFEAMEDGVYIVNQNYDIEYVNSAVEKEFGRHTGVKCYEYFHDRKDVCPWCPNKKVFEGETVRWEWHSPKNEKTYDLIDTPIKNPDGSISKLEIFRDITARKKTEDELNERLDELTRWQKATVKRELSFAEMTGKVKRLEEELKSHK